MENILVFIIDKILGVVFPLFKRSIIIFPKNKKVKTSNDAQSTYRYLISLINQKNRPFYNLSLRLAAKAENMPAQIMVNPVFDGQEHKPMYPIAAGNPRNEPVVDFGFMGFFNADAKHFSYNLRIDHIDPRETKKLEVVISHLKPNRKFKVEHKLTFDKNQRPLEVKKETGHGQISVSIQGFNWKIKK